jgi:hypothetical protein
VGDGAGGGTAHTHNQQGLGTAVGGFMGFRWARGATLRIPQIRPSACGHAYTRKMATGEGEKKAEATYTPKYTGAHAQPVGSRRGQNGEGGGLVGVFRTPQIHPDSKNPAGRGQSLIAL